MIAAASSAAGKTTRHQNVNMVRYPRRPLYGTPSTPTRSLSIRRSEQIRDISKSPSWDQKRIPQTSNESVSRRGIYSSPHVMECLPWDLFLGHAYDSVGSRATVGWS